MDHHPREFAFAWLHIEARKGRQLRPKRNDWRLARIACMHLKFRGIRELTRLLGLSCPQTEKDGKSRETGHVSNLREARSIFDIEMETHDNAHWKEHVKLEEYMPLP